jgi:CDP-glucose 4,6-dehydratase
MNPSFWKDKQVLLTGHAGFKGSWLPLRLQDLVADMTGYSIEVRTEPPRYDAAEDGDGVASLRSTVRDLASLRSLPDKVGPEIIVHKAAQSLVHGSYADPVQQQVDP